MSTTERARWNPGFIAALWALAVTLQGCVFMRPASAPMGHTMLQASATRSDTAMVLLPGMGDDDETFSEEGFIAAIRKVAPTVDLIATDAHFGYYREENLVKRLAEDVVKPLRAQGYTKIYMAGISIGGYGTMGFARTYPELVDGVLLFAPYLGPSEVIEEVRDSGGLCQYSPRGPVEGGNEGFARANFQWLRQTLCEGSGPPLYTAVGNQDDIARALPYITSEMPDSHSLVLPGGHGWEVWTPAAETLVSRALGPKAVHSRPEKVEKVAPVTARAH